MLVWIESDNTLINRRKTLTNSNLSKKTTTPYDITYVEYDANNDGVYERRAIFSNETKIAEGIDLNNDNNEEFRFYFEGAEATLNKFILDSDSNGIPECEEEYSGGKIIKREIDNLFGYVITQINTNPEGKIISAEIDNNKNGVFDYRLTYDENGKATLEEL